MRHGILWNTYAGDFDWFRFSARSFSTFARGWRDAVCFVPRGDEELFKPVCDQHHITLLSGSEWPGKGFNWHQFWQCAADLLLPESDVIFHLDSDTVFTQEVRPQMWYQDGKLLAAYRRFDRMPQDWGPGMWKSRVDAAIGGNVEFATMVTPPYVHRREVYVEARRAIVAAHPEGVEAYIQACQNEFPQGFCEFETLGAIAQSKFRELYYWLDVTDGTHPMSRFVAEGWSHGGLDTVTDRFDGLTARQVFTALGL